MRTRDRYGCQSGCGAYRSGSGLGKQLAFTTEVTIPQTFPAARRRWHYAATSSSVTAP
jgi:hypothetical protein